MTREQYLLLLRAELTGRLPRPELEDIMRYYTEYLEDAGPEREREVMTALGSPQRLAEKILGEESPRMPVAASWEAENTPQQHTPPIGGGGGGGMPLWLYILLLVLAAVFAGPVLLGLVFGLGLAGVLCLVIGLWVAFGAIGAGLGLAGVLFQVGGGMIAAAVGIVLGLGAAGIVWATVKLIRSFRENFVEGGARFETNG